MVYKEYVDQHGTQTTQPSRTAFNNMMADASHALFDTILVCKLQEIARSMLGLRRLVSKLESYSVRLMIPRVGVTPEFWSRHSSGDKEVVRTLYNRLKSDGFTPWLDQENLLPGQHWDREIRQAVRTSDAVVVCLSESSITKEGYVQKEIKLALDVAEEKPEGTIFLIPARLEDCKVPNRLDGWQWVDLFDARG